MATLNCPAVISTDANGIPYCTDGNGVAVAWTSVVPFDPSQVTAAEWAEPFTWGFGVVVTAWLMGWAVGTILRAIRRS